MISTARARHGNPAIHPPADAAMVFSGSVPDAIRETEHVEMYFAELWGARRRNLNRAERWKRWLRDRPVKIMSRPDVGGESVRNSEAGEYHAGERRQQGDGQSQQDQALNTAVAHAAASARRASSLKVIPLATASRTASMHASRTADAIARDGFGG